MGKNNELKLNEGQNMYKQFITLLLIMANYDRLVSAAVEATTADAEATPVDIPDTWDTLTQDVKDTWHSCATNLSVPLWKCLKRGSLEVFDKMTNTNVIPLTTVARLVRYEQDEPEARSSISLSWAEHILHRISKVLATHTLQVDLFPKETARHRNRNQFLPMMLFGMTAFGIVTIPMGFQMLAVLGGKALLLAKMALLLASMNGLKRVATSGVSYGLYHAGPHHGHQSHAYWDRQDENHPRSVEQQYRI